jgi:hypothetical protein
MLSSFFWNYLITQLPGRWLADRFGAKAVLGFTGIHIASKEEAVKTVWSLCVVGLALCLNCLGAQAKDTPEKAATAAAESWLSKIDTGSYAVSWREASAYFQGAVTEQAWTGSLDGLRKPLGLLVSRKLKSAQHTKAVPGALDGEYVIMQFETSFEHKKTAIETVTFLQDKNSKWKAAGYYIK